MRAIATATLAFALLGTVPAFADPLPPPVGDTLDRLCDVDLCLAPPPWFDRTVCPVVGSTLYPGVPGYVDVSPWGDVDVLGTRYYSCYA
jgi:hypothetical protein